MPKIWEGFTNKSQWKDYLKNLIKTNRSALYKAIIIIYDMQTEEEKYIGHSSEDNGVGFTKVDAKEMGDIAKKIKNNESLTKGEIAKSINKMQKYWKQLMIISKRKLQLQKEKRQEEELIETQIRNEANEQIEKLKLFKEFNETLRLCADEGKICGYGICDECLLTMKLQTHLL